MSLLVLWIFLPILGAAVLSRYNKAGTGFLLGLFLGPIGVLIAVLIRSDASKKEEKKRHNELIAATKNDHDDRRKRECPHCAEMILAKAKVCKHCNREVEPLKDLEVQPWD